MIPKVIYYVWLGKSPLPKQVQENIQSWKKFNPDFKVIRIDEQNYDISKINFVKEAYMEGKWAFASDAVRLDVIYHYGGFYLDTDVTLIDSLNKFRTNKSVWALETVNNINTGLILGANSGDPTVGDILNIYKGMHFSSKNIPNLITTGIVSDYFIKKGLKPVNKLQVLARNIYIYPSEYFAPYHWWGGGKITKKTVAIQNYSKSWGSDNDVSFRGLIRLNLRHHFPKLFYLVQKMRKRK